MANHGPKILITVGIFPPEIGGPATFVPRMATSLSKRGYRVTVVAPQGLGVTCPIENHNYRLIRFQRVNLFRYLNYILEFWRSIVAIFFEARSCDLIFVNGLGLQAAFVGILLRKPFIIKVVGDKAWEWSTSKGWTKNNLDDFQEENES